MTAKEYIEKIPTKVSEEAISDKETRFHFDLTGDNATQMTLEIDNGTINVMDGLQGEANCVISGKEKNFVDVVTGKTNATMAMMMGKLKVSNLSEVLKYAKLLGLM